ncbi:YcgN family cysteine cluster protein [Congregibacter sp.]|uniref:YcgN family cysteine cluster protein n=1 Tax=Congregibacter sp. TaxID=2744308 RepID=UPI003F6C8E58
MNETPFWESVAPGDMSREQWESLCDGCARCCLHKLEDAYGGGIYYTDVACHLLDETTCQCSSYATRQKLVPDCVVLTPDDRENLAWLPDTCAYRLVDAGKPLPEWHPLVTGDPNSVHLSGMSVRGRSVSENEVAEDDFEEHIIRWVTNTQTA